MADDNDGGQQGGGQEPQQPDGGQGDGGKPEPDTTDWKAEARKWEQRAKDNAKAAKENSAAAKKLADLEAANQTAQEKAEAAAKAAEERAAAALARAGSSELRSLLTEAGVPNAAAIVEDLNLARFTGEDGSVDPEKAAALVEKYKPLIPPSGPRAPAPNPAQGNGSAPRTLAEQIAAINLNGATPGERRQAVSQSLGLKARQLTQLRNNQG